MRPLAPLFLIFCAACERQASLAASPDIRTQRLAALDQIAAECQVPRSMFELVGKNELHLRPKANDDYRRVACALTKLRNHGLLRNTPMGFVGNEEPGRGTSNAQAH